MRSLSLITLILISHLLMAAELSIGEITFTGNFIFPDSKLQSQIFSAPGLNFNQQTLNNDLIRIVEFYEQNGYYNVQILPARLETPSPDEINIIIPIRENEEIIIKEIILKKNNYISAQIVGESVRLTGLTLPQVSECLLELVDFYANLGFLFAKVELDSIRFDDTGYYAFCTVHEGEPFEIRDYKFRGNKITRESTLLKIAQLISIKTVTPEFLNQAAERIREKPYIKECDLVPLNNSQLLLEIKEDKMTLLNGILGYDNRNTGDDALTGFINLEFLNLFGTDRSLAFTWQKLKPENSLIRFNYHESGLNNLPVGADFLLSREEADSTYTRVEFETEFYYYNFSNLYGLYFGLDQIFPGSRYPRLITRENNQKFGAFWRYNKVDNHNNPSRGSKLYLKYYGILNKKSGNRVYRNACEISWDNYYPIRKNFILAQEMEIKIIENKDITRFDTFPLGGFKSLRGFTENQFTGYRTGLLSIELRYLLDQRSRLFFFLDYGYVENPEFRFGKLGAVGIGFRFDTRIGLLGIDYGLGYSDNKLNEPSRGIIHFGIETKI
ncbi:MAG: BamA/TamA family outer membrane protein [Candidatus Cloacimonetes bacterium]|nr:BamA/TamA family outer membrane protein [Candidatus Cloacimonadota bacterium]